ncbi:hypothetical protein BTM25_38470 [Actinomadura rubteroloni]|uniref:DUF4097 domain-containing protein n=1 Tax=Actinomadura rubteroloni TaxID=1926885 RepID=A0A2P4UJI0_9ACTN|nr:DUF4097 family beta strand repeat-containing protein [Actinomadura rubteroloni]POM25204.1 hypothetical protein BTM25_38470 [Actinomadura rubteroloni]
MKTVTGTVLAGAAVLTLGGCGLVSTGGTRHAERTYDVAGTSRGLDVRANGAVEIVGADTDKVTVRERERWSNDRNKPRPAHAVRDGVLTLSSHCKHAVIGGACAVRYRITVPRALAVTVNDKDGAITVRDATGTLNFTTSTGSINAENVTTAALTARSGAGRIRVSGKAGTADLRTGTGAIDVERLESTSLKASTGDGAVRVAGRADQAELRTSTGSIHSAGLRSDRLTVRTGDGSVRLAFTVPPAKVDARTSTGSIYLTLPATASYAIDAETNTGGRRIDDALRVDSAAPRHLDLRTGDGSITVRAA